MLPGSGAAVRWASLTRSGWLRLTRRGCIGSLTERNYSPGAIDIGGRDNASPLAQVWGAGPVLRRPGGLVFARPFPLGESAR